MKKTLLSTAISLAACAAFADINVSTDTTVATGTGTIKFTKPNVTLTVTGDWTNGWNSPRADFGSYVYEEGDKVTLLLASGATYTCGSGRLFADSGQSPSPVDIYISGAGKMYSAQNSITVDNPKPKFFVDVDTDFNNVALTVGNGTNATNMTVSNKFIVKTLTLAAGSTLRLAADADSAAAMSFTGTGVTSTIRGTLIQEAGAGLYSNTGQTSVYGTLDLSVEQGFRSKSFTVYDGSTIIIRANNAIMQDATNYRLYSVNSGATNTLKLYANQRFASLWFNGGTSVVNAYTNGYELTFGGLNNPSNTGTLNLFIEEGFEWQNDKIHITSATVEAVTALIGKIQIGDTVIDESLWDITSDGASGVYVNLLPVPEPAEWAMILGALALAVAAYRRRK